MQNEEIKEKIKQTNLKKYGYEIASKSDIVKEKVKQTNLERYGIENYTQTEEYNIRNKKISLEKYGTEHYLQSEIVKNKRKETMLDKYGVEYPLQVQEFKEKAANSFYKNGSIKTSNQQLEIYNLLKENNYKVELNYPVSNINLDVAIFIDDIKIDLEYDAWYWHQDKQKDRRRDEFLKSQDWKILRIKSGHKIPMLEQIEEQIIKLINDKNRSYTHLILDDWKEQQII